MIIHHFKRLWLQVPPSVAGPGPPDQLRVQVADQEEAPDPGLPWRHPPPACGQDRWARGQTLRQVWDVHRGGEILQSTRRFVATLPLYYIIISIFFYIFFIWNSFQMFPSALWMLFVIRPWANTSELRKTHPTLMLGMSELFFWDAIILYYMGHIFIRLLKQVLCWQCIIKWCFWHRIVKSTFLIIWVLSKANRLKVSDSKNIKCF